MNKAQPFKQHSLTRALRAAKAAGMESVEVHLPTGTKIVISGASGDKDLKSAPSASKGGKSGLLVVWRFRLSQVKAARVESDERQPQAS
jgi:hypothetical protein